MNKGELYQKVYESVKSNKPVGIHQALRDYQISHCYHPVRVRVFNSVLGVYELKELPCGKCYHCLETKSNEWVSRMTAHLEDFKYVYFITLTYRSFEPDIIEHKNTPKFLVLNYLKDALFVLDSNNSNNHLSWNPCVLVKSHYQNFLKRLRLIINSPISYVAKGEYGSDYGRPHYHLVIYSNVPISHRLFQEAWSISVCKSKGNWKYKTSHKNCVEYHMSLGRVDYNDLVQNGTIPDLDKNIVNVDGQLFSTKRCFAYVSKYLNKDEYNTSRVSLSHYYITKLSDALDFDIQEQNVLDNNFISYLYENYKIFISPLSLFIKDDFEQFYRVFPNCWNDYQRYFKPFHECSRGTAIGSLFIKRNLQKYIEGVDVKPMFQKENFIVPNYFRRKVEEYLFGLRSTSHTKTHSSTKGNLAMQMSHFSSLSEDEFLRIYGFKTDSYHGEMEILNSRYAFKDLSTGNRFLIVYDSVSTPTVLVYKYYRSIKNYVRVNDMSLSDFVKYWLDKYLVYYEKYISRYNDSLFMQEKYDVAKSLINETLSDICVPTVRDFEHGSIIYKTTPFDMILYNTLESLQQNNYYKQKIYTINHHNEL